MTPHLFLVPSAARVGAALLTLAATTCVPASDTPGAAEADNSAEAVEAAVTDQVRRYLAAVEERDTAAVRATLGPSERFIWIEDGEPRYPSVDALLEGLSSFPPGASVQTLMPDLHVHPVGEDVAHVWGPFATTVGVEPGAFTFRGAISFLLERRADGWRIVAGHTSSAPRSDGEPGPWR